MQSSAVCPGIASRTPEAQDAQCMNKRRITGTHVHGRKANLYAGLALVESDAARFLGRVSLFVPRSSCLSVRAPARDCI